MTITLEAIRAAGGIVHSDGNIFFRDISMLQGLAGAAPAAVLDVHAIAAAVCQRVAELPDRDSPEDWPEAMLVTGPELIDAVADEIEQALAQAAPALEAPAAPTLVGDEQADSYLAEPGRLATLARSHPAGLVRALARAALAAAPQAPAAPSQGAEGWAIDKSTGTDILVYKGCSVIEDEQAHRLLALLSASPAAPSADERTAYVEFLAGKFPQTYSKEDAEHWWDHGHVSALAWQAARGAQAAPAAPAVDASDTALLDAIERERIAVIPEFEGPWDAQIFGEDEATLACGSGATPRKAITEALASLEARKAHDAAQAKEGGDQ